MKFEKILRDENKHLLKHLETNVIFNRFDLRFDDYELYVLLSGKRQYYVPIHLSKKNLLLGLYMREVPKDLLDEFITYLFEAYPKIKSIKAEHSITPVGALPSAPHWHVDLPASIQDFDAALSSKTRYNTKWYPKKIQEDLGYYTIKHYKLSEITEDVVLRYLELKQHTHDVHYKLQSAKDYLSKFSVTDAYTLDINGAMEAILFLSITGDNVFLENLTYNTAFAKYSLGSVLYHHVIGELILKRKKILYLLGGTLDYKRRFNGVETQTYTGKILRPSLFKKIIFKIFNTKI